MYMVNVDQEIYVKCLQYRQQQLMFLGPGYSRVIQEEVQIDNR